MLAICLAAILAVPAAAQEEPWEPVRGVTVVVPANPGGGWDQTGRFLRRAMESADLVPTGLEVVNRGGAGGTIALAELVSRGRGDPHRLMVGGYAMVSSGLMNGSAFSPLSATPIARLTAEYQVIAVTESSPFQTVGELFAAVAERGKGVAFAGGAAGGTDHIFIVEAAMAAGLEPDAVNYVAFGGGGDVAGAVMGGQVAAGVSGYGEFKALADSGRLRILAISAPDRRVDPDVPTLREAGVDVEFQNWRGVFAAPGITEAQADWLRQKVADARGTELWREVLGRNGWQDSYLSGEAFADFIARDRDNTRAVMAAMGLLENGGGGAAAPVGPWAFPAGVGLGLVVCAVAVGVAGRRSGRGGAEAEMAGGDAAVGPSWRRFGVMAGILLGYAVALGTVGFAWASPPFVFAVATVFLRRVRAWTVVFAAAASGAVWALFEVVLGVGLP